MTLQAGSMQPGERRPLSSVTPARQLRVTVTHDLPGLDVSLFGLNADRQLEDDRYFIFYNQTESPAGELRAELQGGEATFTLRLDALPPQARRLVFVATHDDLPLRDARQLSWSLGGVRFEPLPGLQDERAVMIAELYERAGEWRFGAIGQGFNGGLQALLESFGGRAEEAAAVQPLPVSSPHQAQSWPLFSDRRLMPTDANACRRCGQEARWLRRLDPHTGRCGSCQNEVQRTLHHFRQEFLAAARDDVLTEGEWLSLHDLVLQERLDGAEAIEYIRADALGLLNRTVSLFADDGEITASERETVERLLRILELPDALSAPARHTLDMLNAAARIRAGQLPSVQTTAVLDAGERCHLDTPAVYYKVGSRAVTPVSGRLIVTSKQLFFTSPGGGHKIRYANILAVTEQGAGVHLELSVKSGSGLYGVAEPLLATAILDTALRADKRQLPVKPGKPSRHIPRHVKTEVWNRDSGACVECSASDYLEYDHIIPHSLGGSNEVRNIQLLCRRCNLEKSNRI